MAPLSLNDWFRHSQGRPRASFSPPETVSFWLHRDEMQEEFVEIFCGTTSVAVEPLCRHAHQQSPSGWVNVRVQLPKANLLRAREAQPRWNRISCVLGRAAYAVGGCSLKQTDEFDPAYVNKLRQFSVTRDWNTSYVFLDRTRVIVGGWGLSRDVSLTPRVWIAGTAAEVERRKSPHAASRYWYLPGAEWFGFEARSDPGALPDWLKIEMEPDHSDPIMRYARWQFLGRRDSLGPIPPESNIQRVSGALATQNVYVNSGYTEFRTIKKIFEGYGVDIASDETRVLDWGCGCARITRHVLGLSTGETRVFGVDIDADNIEWCKTNLASRNFFQVGLWPPMPFENGSMDAVFAVSVLSHLREDVAGAWLKEVARVLSPRGLAVLTYNGLPSAGIHLAAFPRSIRSLETDGALDFRRSDNLDGHVPDRDYYRLIFFTDEHAASLFSSHFELVGLEPCCIAGGQSAVILRKRS